MTDQLTDQMTNLQTEIAEPSRVASRMPQEIELMIPDLSHFKVSIQIMDFGKMTLCLHATHGG